MWNKPIVEIRTEEFTRGCLPDYLDRHKRLALPTLTAEMGRPMAYFITLVGRINCVTQLWGFDSLDERHEAQMRIESTSDWKDYLKTSEGILRFTTSRLTRRVVLGDADQGAEDARAKPVVDFRTYKIDHGKMGTFLQTSEDHALPVMRRHIGPPLGYYLNISGDTNEITHLWGYDGMGDMEARRESRNADPTWRNYLEASHGIYERQDTQILKRLPLFDDA
ncbi:NIPSNAP family protein [Celeribacter naphthalenivorans]|uniref:NIPSNAP family protein n=1 Tax=Celeribacter naphthalenivorans TaxID=1614694 RepID=UPI001CF9DE36|nr:NIPSNAP family protein [Celeribacter naphthalenivorans]